MAMSLPLLDIMRPAGICQTPGAAEVPPVRLGWFFFPNGVVQEKWKPTGEGGDFQFNESNKSLEAVREHVVVCSNLAQFGSAKTAEQAAAGAHARGSAAFLTSSLAKKTNGKDIYLGVSADQVAAD